MSLSCHRTFAFITMAAIDFDRKPTKVFYTVQRSFAPVCASLEYDPIPGKVANHIRCGIWPLMTNWESVPGAISTGAFWMPGRLRRPPANGL